MRRRAEGASPPERWTKAYPVLSDRLLAEGRLDPAQTEAFPTEELRAIALDAAGYIHAIGAGGRIATEAYYLVLQVCVQIAVCHSLNPQALTDAQRADLQSVLAEMMQPLRSWIREDFARGSYAAVSGVWPFAAIRDRLSI